MSLLSTDLPGNLARLEELLGRVGDDVMQLSELDGFLCGILVSPEPIAAGEWWPLPFLADERPRELTGERRELASLVEQRFSAMEAELAAGAYAPLYHVDEVTGDVAWQLWLSGFEQAMQLRFAAWDELLRHPYQDVVGEAATRLATALLLAQPEFGPDDTATDADWADYDTAMASAPENLAVAAMLLYQAHSRSRQG